MTARWGLAWAATLLFCGCGRDGPAPVAAAESAIHHRPGGGDVARGRDLWFDATYGGEKFFALLAQHPDPQRRLDVGFRNVLLTPRAERYERWGTINDPDCVADPAGGFDRCPDPHASGVVGIRRFTAPDGRDLFGVSCASCHAGFDPLDPPADPAEPAWENIHPTIGNQDLRAGAIFAANLAPDDVRRLLFASWPDGTVDTSLLVDDHIRNPGTITAFWNLPDRPTFDVGEGAPVLRSGQGGEDDRGAQTAALRVYTNIGVCFVECSAPALAAGRPLSIDACRRDCPDLPPERDLDDLVAFMRSIRSPEYPGRPHGGRYERGRRVFDAECAGCHADRGRQRDILSDDEVVPLRADPDQATNACRALGSNWEAGHIWAEFSSRVYKDRVARGDRGYRVMPLAGIWATAPYLHNQSVGYRAWATASPEARAAVFEASMRQLLEAARPPVVQRLPFALGPFPAGTPLTLVFSRDPETGATLCADPVENRGHHYGSDLGDDDKRALIEFLRFQ